MIRTMLFLALVGCSGGAKGPTPPGPVSVGTWCHSVGEHICDQAGLRCGKPMDMASECASPLVKQCLNGRDANKESGKMGPDLDKCLAYLDTAECEGLKDPSKLDMTKAAVCVIQ
jgi:hypothetical protein